MSQTKHERNKALVLEAFDTLFNKRDYVAAERYWSPTYIQHSAHIAPGREGLFDLIKSMPPTLKYEPGVIVADGDFGEAPRAAAGDDHLIAAVVEGFGQAAADAGSAAGDEDRVAREFHVIAPLMLKTLPK